MHANLMSKLQSEDIPQIKEAISQLGTLSVDFTEKERAEAVEVVMGIFYIDTIDHPEMVSVLERAEDWLATQPESIIPTLLGCLADSDFKIDFHIASTLGKMGDRALNHILKAHREATDQLSKVFTLYAIGKVRGPKAKEAIPVLIEEMDNEDQEVRDTATRAVGKVFENINSHLLDEPTRKALFGKLIEKVSDPTPGVRSKAFRSLGKMTKLDLINVTNEHRLLEICKKTLGESEAQNWDIAYVVRMEAKKTKNLIDQKDAKKYPGGRVNV